MITENWELSEEAQLLRKIFKISVKFPEPETWYRVYLEWAYIKEYQIIGCSEHRVTALVDGEKVVMGRHNKGERFYSNQELAERAYRRACQRRLKKCQKEVQYYRDKIEKSLDRIVALPRLDFFDDEGLDI